MIRKFNDTYLRPLSDLSQTGNLAIFSLSPGNVIANWLVMEANQFKTGDIVRIRSFWTKTGTRDTTAIRLWFNTTLSTSGATQLAFFNFVAGNRQQMFTRRFCFLSPSSAVGMLSTFDATHGEAEQATTIETFSISNWLTNSGYFFMTYSTTNSKGFGESVNGYYLSIEV